MSSMKITDSTNRSELSSLLSLGNTTLEELIRNDVNIEEHLKCEDITRSWRETTNTLQQQLQHHKCAIVVAGTPIT